VAGLQDRHPLDLVIVEECRLGSIGRKVFTVEQDGR
jgi:hypothetical protein